MNPSPSELMDDIYYRVSKEQDAWFREMKTPPPEPPAHVCGRCRNPFTGGRPDCPNNKRTPVIAEEDT
jgi:hypothetical protein